MQGSGEGRQPQGLGEIVVHAGCPATFGIAFDGIGGHGDNRSAPPGLRLQRSNLRGGLVSVEIRHLAIHQDGGEFRPVDRFQGGFTAGDDLRHISQLVHGTRGYNLVHGIVVDNQDTLSGSSRDGRRRLPQRKHEPEDGAAVRPAIDIDGATHEGDQPM